MNQAKQQTNKSKSTVSYQSGATNKDTELNQEKDNKRNPGMFKDLYSVKYSLCDKQLESVKKFNSTNSTRMAKVKSTIDEKTKSLEEKQKQSKLNKKQDEEVDEKKDYSKEVASIDQLKLTEKYLGELGGVYESFIKKLEMITNNINVELKENGVTESRFVAPSERKQKEKVFCIKNGSR
jgi:hypothetical protein